MWISATIFSVSKLKIIKSIYKKPRQRSCVLVILAASAIFTRRLYWKIIIKFYILTVVRLCGYKDEFASDIE